MKTPDEIRVDIVSLIEARFENTNRDFMHKLMSINDINILQNLYERTLETDSFEECCDRLGTTTSRRCLGRTRASI